MKSFRIISHTTNYSKNRLLIKKFFDLKILNFKKHLSMSFTLKNVGIKIILSLNGYIKAIKIKS